MENQKPELRTKASFYFLFAFIWSILFWSLTVAFGGIEQFPGSVLQFVGGAGPLIAALVITHFFESTSVQKDFWSRTFNLRRIPWPWLIPALFIHPVVILVAVLVEVALGGTMQVQANLANPRAFINLVFFVFVFGPLPEEMGWRGVAYDRLQQQMNALQASLLLGVAWAAWHIPLFFIEGTFQNQMGIGSFRFWIFLASNIPLTVIITWVYNHTKRSILSAVFVHFSGNILGAILSKTNQLAFFELIGLTLVAGLIIARSGVELGSRPEPEF